MAPQKGVVSGSFTRATTSQDCPTDKIQRNSTTGQNDGITQSLAFGSFGSRLDIRLSFSLVRLGTEAPTYRA